jgi:site-specific recombinase XerD
VDRFLGFLSSSEKSPNTVKSYAHDLKDWFSYLSGRGLAWDEVTLEDVAAFVAWLRLPPQGRDGTVAVLGEQAHHCGASTVNRKLAAVASFYRFHARRGAKAAGVLRAIQAPGRGYAGTAFRPFLHHVTGQNPQPRLAVKVTAARRLPRVLTAPQAQAGLDACGHLRDRLLLAMLLEAGLRIGEALGMRHEDIDIGGCLVHVVPRDNANGMRAKGGRGRAVPAGAPLMRLYADYLNREYGAVDSDYVFVNLWAAPVGRPMTYPAAYDLVTRLRSATGIAFSPHWCRHTYATWLQVSRVALDATFGGLGECPLPGPQRRGCIALTAAVGSRHADDLVVRLLRCIWCQDVASDSVASDASFVASDACTGGCYGWDTKNRGLGGADAGRWRDAAAARARVVRGDAGGLAPAAGGAAAEQAADRGPGPPDPPVPGVHRGVAMAVDARAGGGVGCLGRLGAFDDPLV